MTHNISGSVAAPDTATTSSERSHIDGRTVRRASNTAAVVDATIQLLAEGQDHPTAQAIADRADVSLRSVFRYFRDLDELITTAVLTQAERLGPYLGFSPPDADTPLDERIEYLVQHRLRQYGEVGPTLRAAMHRSREIPDVRDMIAGARANAAPRLATLFGPELDGLDQLTRAALIGAVHNLTLFEGYDNLVERHGMTPDQIGDVYRIALRRLLQHGDVPERQGGAATSV